MAVTVASSNTATGSTNSLVITKPTGLASGDLMVCFLSGNPNGGVIDTPSGWTSAQSTSSTFVMQKTIWKVADSTDASATNFTFTRTANSTFFGCLARITGQDTTTPIATSNSATMGTTNTITITTVTPSKSNSLLMLGGVALSAGSPRSFSGYATANNNPTWTEIQDTGAISGRYAGLAYATYSPSSATGNCTISLSNTEDESSGHIVVINPLGDSYSITASVGSFSLTGIAALLKIALTITASVGSFVLSGIASNLKRGFGIVASAGSFVLSGIDLILKSSRTMSASVGTFTLTGIESTFKRGYGFIVEMGNFLLTGQNAILRPSNIWTNISKSISSWTNSSKNSTSWTNDSKNTSTWTNKPKS